MVEQGQAWERYAATDDCAVLIRPDGYLTARWPTFSQDALDAAFEKIKAL